jgi:formylglycine-generating enzyme required for sulfatase activity
VLVDDLWMARTELTKGQQRAAGGRADAQAETPLASLDWQEAVDACGHIGAGLPTEAQWEYAARAGTADRWSFGEDAARLGDYAWFRDNAEKTAHAVGEKVPNGLCLADMHGNVFEWITDCYDPQVYGSRDALTINPMVDQSGCQTRVVRGGSFGSPPGFLRSAGRGFARPDVRSFDLGLRCVRSRARQP